MRIAKLIGALFVVLAFSAVAVATASAAETLWKLLPGSVGETFKGSSGKAVLQLQEVEKIKPSITCAKSAISLAGSQLLKEGSTGEKDATLALAIIDFESCTSFGLPANSDGDGSGVILVHLEIHNCMISKGVFGLLLTPLPLHIEIPAGKKLVNVRGSFVAEALGKEGEKLLTYKLNIKQTAGVQEIKKCEGGTEDSLEGSIDDGKTFVKAGQEAATPVLEFDMIKDTAGEEMMEK